MLLKSPLYQSDVLSLKLKVLGSQSGKEYTPGVCTPNILAGMAFKSTMLQLNDMTADLAEGHAALSCSNAGPVPQQHGGAQ